MMRSQGDELEDAPPALQRLMTESTQLQRRYQAMLDRTTPHVAERWAVTGVLLVIFMLRIVFAQGWYIVCYALFIYLLNLFLAFLQPKFDPSLDADLAAQDVEEGEPGLPTDSGKGKGPANGNGGGLMSGVFGGNGNGNTDDEFRPFIRRLPEFKFWLGATQAIAISIFCTMFAIFDIPVFWPVLVVYWLMLTALTMRRQIQHMIKYRYVPWDLGKTRYGRK